MLATSNAVHPKPPDYDQAAQYPTPQYFHPNPIPEINSPYSNQYNDTSIFASAPLPPIHSSYHTEFNQPNPAPTYNVVSVDAPNRALENPGFSTGSSFSEQKVRRGFIRKLYSVLFLQMILTVAIVSIFTFVEPVRVFIQERVYIIFLSLIPIAILYPIVSFTAAGKRVQRKHPYNICIVLLLTLTIALFTGVIASFFQTEAVIFGFAISAGVCILITVVSFFDKFSIENKTGFLFIIIFCGFWLAIFTPFTYRQVWYIQVVYGFIGAIVFGIFLAYDTNKLLNANDTDLTSEDYIAGSIRIYVDFIFIFLFILLACFGGGGAAN